VDVCEFVTRRKKMRLLSDLVYILFKVKAG
jgi:hypothetical protein